MKEAADKVSDDAAREKARALLTPELFADAEHKSLRIPRGLFWAPLVRQLERAAAGVPERTGALVVATSRAARRVQLPIFVDVATRRDLPIVVDGKLLPEEELRALAKPDLDAAAEAAARKKASGAEWVCLECGYESAGVYGGPLKKVHPANCPNLVALLHGRREGCAACQVTPHVACDEHLQAARRCNAEGHIPGRPVTAYGMRRVFCARCGHYIDKELEAALLAST